MRTAVFRIIVLSATLSLATLVHAQPEACQGRYATDRDVDLGAGIPAASELSAAQRISLDGANTGFAVPSAAKGAAKGAAVGAATGMDPGKAAAAGAVVGG